MGLGSKGDMGFNQYYDLCICHSRTICASFTRKMDLQFDEYRGVLLDFDDLFRSEFLPNWNALLCKWRQGGNAKFCLLFGGLRCSPRILFVFKLQETL